MKRLATLVLAASFSVSSLVAMGQGASATPFSDVPANHWAYQAIQSLAADGLVEGYPDGKFKGDRPLSRYEMAVLVARVIAKVQANGAGYASKADLDKLQKLIDALKDELDSLGVRVTNVEDALDALDKRTKLAQSLQLHGSLVHNFTQRQSNAYPHSILNGTGAAQPLYYGGAAASTRSAGVDPFTEQFLRSPENNSPLEPGTVGNQVRFEDKINLSYAINENLTVAFPIHIINDQYGGEFTPTAKYSIQPDILVNVAKAGAITGLYMRFGQLDNMKSSRVGLTYRAPDASQQGPGFEYPIQPYQKGVQFGGVINGLTEFQVNLTRVDQTLLDTQNTTVLDQTGEITANSYLFPYVRNQTSYVQPGAPGSTAGSLRSNTFNAGTGALTGVYLNNKAQAGTVYISQYNGALFNNASQVIGGTAGVAAPGFNYIDNDNQVVFASPLPAGSSVTITYVALTRTNNTYAQRYEVNARLNHKIKGLPGAEVGLSFNRLFDVDDVSTTGDFTIVPNAPASGYGLVSDTVLGLDAQLPLTFLTISDRSQHPVIYGEASFSKYSPDYRNIPASTDSAAVVGIRLKIYQFTGSFQYQVVGANYLDGAPVRYFGNPPNLFTFYKLPYFPSFFGFGNNLGINQQFDGLTNGCNVANKINCTSQNPNLTFAYPLFNPFVASGPSFFSAFAPNTQGETLNLNSPIKLGDLTINARILAQHLTELRPDSLGDQLYAAAIGGNPSYISNKKMSLDKLDAGAQFNVPAFGQTIGLNLTGGIEHLSRQDKTAYTYVPINPGTLTADPSALAAYAAAAGNIVAAGNPLPRVSFYPNLVDVYHTTLAAAASLPVTKDVVFGASYNTQTYRGTLGTTNTQSIAERKDTYVGSMTYNIPRTTSSVAFAYRNYNYKDAVLPSFNNNLNKEDITFVIRF